MPVRPGRLCVEPGCGRRAPAGKTRCADHQAKVDARRAEKRKDVHQRYNEGRDEVDAFYKTERWKKLSAYYRRLHPLCEECARVERVRPSAMTDHIKPVRTHPELALDWDNLRALCWPCHNQVGERVGRSGADPES